MSHKDEKISELDPVPSALVDTDLLVIARGAANFSATILDLPGVSGDVTGPAGGVLDDEIATFNGSSGKFIQGNPTGLLSAEVQAHIDDVTGNPHDTVDGPNGGVVDDEIPVFNGITGKLIRSNATALLSAAVQAHIDDVTGNPHNTVDGPVGGVVDDEIALFDGVTGKLIKSSGITNLVQAFLDLTDTPADYVGKATQSVVVNAGATGLEFSPNNLNPFAWNHVATLNAASSATLDFTAMRAEFDYMFVLNRIDPSVDAVRLRARVRQVGQGSFEVTNYSSQFVSYTAGDLGVVAGNASSTGTETRMEFGFSTGPDSGTASNEELNGMVQLINPNSTRIRSTLSGQLWGINSASNKYGMNANMTWEDTSVVDAISFFFASGNIINGDIEIFERQSR